MKIFITGVSDGVGRELTKQLVRKGDEVWGVARRAELLLELQKELGAKKFHFSAGDVSIEKFVRETIAEMEGNNFLPDVVVLNAAVFSADAEPQYRHELFVQACETNVFGALIWANHFLADFLKRGSGKFIAVSSLAAFRPSQRSISLSAGKAALSMAFRGLRLRYGKDGIDFSNIYFGPIATKMLPSWSKADSQPRYFFVLSKEEAAQDIIKIMRRKADDYWFPFFTALIFRASLLIPDKFFSAITDYLKK